MLNITYSYVETWYAMIVVNSQGLGCEYRFPFLMIDWVFSLLSSFQIVSDENMLLVLGPLPKEARANINESWYSALVSCFSFRNSCISFYGLICFKHRIFWMCRSLSLFHWMFWGMPLLTGSLNTILIRKYSNAPASRKYMPSVIIPSRNYNRCKK